MDELRGDESRIVARISRACQKPSHVLIGQPEMGNKEEDQDSQENQRERGKERVRHVDDDEALEARWWKSRGREEEEGEEGEK